MFDNVETCQVMLANLRTMCDEIEELVTAPTQEQAGIVRTQLDFVTGKLELAVAMAAQGAGMVPADAEPQAPQKTIAERQKELMDQMYPNGVPKSALRRRKATPRKRKAA